MPEELRKALKILDRAFQEALEESFEEGKEEGKRGAFLDVAKELEGIIKMFEFSSESGEVLERLLYWARNRSMMLSEGGAFQQPPQKEAQL